MKKNINVKKLIKRAVDYIKTIADEDDIFNYKLHIKNGCVTQSLDTGETFNIFEYLTKDGGKELFNELFIKDDTIIKAFKEFAEKYGYVDAAIEIEDCDDYTYHYVYPIFYLCKSKDTFIKEIINEFKENMSFAKVNKYEPLLNFKDKYGCKFYNVSVPNINLSNFTKLCDNDKEEIYDELLVQDDTILNLLKSFAEDNGYADGVIKYTYGEPFLFVCDADINKKLS